MLKKFNKYLLENHPLLWNLRIPHLTIILVPTLLIFFIFGFLLCDPNANRWGLFSTLDTGFYFLLSIAILGSIVMYILWLVKYNNNNSVDNFYPRTSVSVYTEWLGSVFITFLFICIPVSMFWGANLQMAFYKNKTSNTSDRQTVIMGNMLLPSDSTDYEINGKEKPLQIKTNTDLSNIPADQMQHTADGVIFIGPSLLYYDSYSYSFEEEEYDDAVAKAKKMLESEDTDGIRTVMKNYLAFCKKNSIDTDLSVNTWFNMVYNPPYYPINNDNMVNDHSNYNSIIYDNDNGRPNVDKSTAESYFGRDYYDDFHLSLWFIYILYSSVGISLLVYGYRFSKGNSILFAFVSIVVLWFLFGILSALFAFGGINSSGFYLFIWLIPLVAIWGLLIYKTSNNLPKKFSRIYFHLGIWFIPYILPYFIIFIINFQEDFFDINFTSINIINMIFVILIMYPVSIFSLKWKSLPED